MMIPVTCSGCSGQYEVDERYAGRTVNCGYCNQPMKIPNAERELPASMPAHGEYQLDEPLEPASSTFRAARETSSKDSEWTTDRNRAKKKSSGRSRRQPARAEPAVSRPVILITMAALVILLILLAAIAPSTRKIVGMAIALPGLLLCVYGYASGAYIAFTEDDLYLWLYILIPCYAAYYYVSRWDEMRSRLAMVVVGLILLSIGGQMLKADLVPKDAGKAGAALSVSPGRGFAEMRLPLPRAGLITAASDHFADGLLFFEEEHRAAASVSDGGAGVDTKVVVERGEDVLEGDGAILGVTGRLVG